jgi:hypothetical protein
MTNGEWRIKNAGAGSEFDIRHSPFDIESPVCCIPAGVTTAAGWTRLKR